MLIHEIPEGGYGYVADKLFIRPPGCKAFLLPTEVRAVTEKDGTLTLMDPVKATHCAGVVVKCFLIHDKWHQSVADLAA